MRDAALPHNHGAWLVLATALLLGGLAGGGFQPGLVVLTVATLASFVAVERFLAGPDKPRARRSALVAMAVAAAAGGWLVFAHAGTRLLGLAPAALLFGLAAARAARQRGLGARRRFELLGMCALALALPAASLVAGCPVSWPLAALSLAFLLHVAHAVLRTHAHLDARLRRRAQEAGLLGASAVLALAVSGGLPLPIAGAVLVGMVEPWLPAWRTLPAKRAGRREAVLISGLPVAWLLFAG